MDLLCQAAQLKRSRNSDNDENTPTLSEPSSPSCTIKNLELNFETPTKKRYVAIDVFCVQTGCVHKMAMETTIDGSDVKSGTSSLCYMVSSCDSIVIRKRFTCARGPIKVKMCKECQNRSNRHQQCSTPYFIHYTKNKPGRDDGTISLVPEISKAYKTFCPSAAAWK